MSFSQELKDTISNGKLRKAIDQLLDISKKSSEKDFYNSVIMLSGRLKTLIRENVDGTISDQELKPYIARAEKSALFYIDEYEDIIDNNDSDDESNSSGKERILFLGANPPDTRPLKLTQEIAKVQAEIDKSILRDTISLNQYWDITPVDMARRLVNTKPTIFHFSGHGEKEEGRIVIFKDDDNYHIIENDALINLLKDRTSIKCIVLNCCYSEKLADKILANTTIECVIGMRVAVPDKTAISFAKGFYMGIGAGGNYETAYELGKSVVELEGISGADIPVFKKAINN